jgi:hypothetical protein
MHRRLLLKQTKKVNQLKDIKDKTETVIWITGLTAEDISDGRDEIMKKDLSKIHCCFHLRMIYFFSKYHISPEYKYHEV